MGYRNPGYDEVEDADTQFEWDGDHQQWLFRRKETDSPVLVTDDEKIWFEKVRGRGQWALYVIFISAIFFGISWMEQTYPDATANLDGLDIPIIIGLAFVIYWPGLRLIDWIATRDFRDRQPQGPVRSRLEIWRTRAGQKSWLNFIFPIFVVLVIVGLHWPPENPGDWAWLAIAGVGAALTLFEAMLKREASRS